MEGSDMKVYSYIDSPIKAKFFQSSIGEKSP